MNQKLLFIINPHAGKGAIQNSALGCIDIFVKAGFDVTVYTTQKPLDATNIVIERAAQFDRIVCAGGDGTLNEVVTGLLQHTDRIPLGYIPAGTVNDFASSLGIPKYPLEAAQIAATGVIQQVDIGRFADRNFCYIAAFGAFTNVSYTTPQAQKNLLGRTAYILEGIKSLPHLKPYHIRIETSCGQSLEDELIYGMVSNATSIGGFKELTPHDVRMDDGLFEVVLIRQPKNPLDWQTIFNELMQSKGDSKFLLRCKASKLQIFSDEEISWTLDGEFGGTTKKVEISNNYRALSILTAPKTVKSTD